MTKILIADDDPDILDLLEYNLAKEGWDVHAASNGKQALSIAQDDNPQQDEAPLGLQEAGFGLSVCRSFAFCGRPADGSQGLQSCRGPGS